MKIFLYKGLKKREITGIFKLIKKNNFCEKPDKKKETDLKAKYNPEALDRQIKRIKILDNFPETVQNYLKLGRYDRPVGYMLLFWPCAWGLTLGAPEINGQFFKILGLFFSGSVLMRSSGCIINDMWDKDIDKKVVRSQDRPLASNKISYKQAALFLSAHLAISLPILLQLPKFSIIAGFGIMPIVCIYPYMKRVTNFPQFFLGMAFNSGILVGLPSMTGLINFNVLLPLYTAGILWTLIYDTIYAHMDKLDDKMINVKSTALYFDDNTKMILSLFTVLMMSLIYISIKNSVEEKTDNERVDLKENISQKKGDNKSPIISASDFFLILATSFQFYSIYSVNLNSPISCLKHFKSNSYFGLLIFLSALFAHSNKIKNLNIKQ